MKSVVITVTYKTSRIVAVSSFVSPSPNSKMSQFSKFETNWESNEKKWLNLLAPLDFPNVIEPEWLKF